MSQGNGGASGLGRARPFSASERRGILMRDPGTPTGVMVSIGGVEFNLVAITSGQLIEVLDVVLKVADVFDSLKNDAITDADIFRVIGKDGGKIIALAKSVLARSANVDGSDQDESAAFDSWFDSLPIMDILKILAPAVMEANGIKLARPQTATPEPKESTPSTPSDTSSPTIPHMTPTAASTG